MASELSSAYDYSQSYEILMKSSEMLTVEAIEIHKKSEEDGLSTEVQQSLQKRINEVRDNIKALQMQVDGAMSSIPQQYSTTSFLELLSFVKFAKGLPTIDNGNNLILDLAERNIKKYNQQSK